MSLYIPLLTGLSWLQSITIFSTLLVLLAGLLVLALPEVGLGARIRKLIAYDDRCLAKGLEALIGMCRVPKSYFSHFYLTGIVSATVALWFACGLYLWPSMCADEQHKRLRQGVDPLLDTKHSQWAGVDGPAALLAVTLVLLHCVRRCYESTCVQVFSPYSDMTLAHYALGHWHYFTLALCALADANVLLGKADKKMMFDGKLSWFVTERLWAHLVGSVLFTYLSWVQSRCLRQLAALRRRPSGAVYTYAHGIVVGGYFDVVSCPHFLCEVGIYLSLHLILGIQAPTWGCVTLFVCVNQIIAALITHNWYRRHFGKLYPEGRHAILPYLL